MSIRNNVISNNVPNDEFLSIFFILRQTITKKNDKNYKKIIKLLDKDEWILDMGAYSNLNMKDFSKNIIQSHILKLWLSHNARESILFQIVSINFPSLKSICLAHNQIYSIEALSFANFQKIEQIQLKQNVITSIKPLQKLKIPQLKTLSLYQNHSLDLTPLTYLTTKNLKTLWVQYQDDQPIQGQSFFWLSKLQSEHLKGIAIGASRRMKQLSIQKSMLRKYLNFKIYRSPK